MGSGTSSPVQASEVPALRLQNSLPALDVRSGRSRQHLPEALRPGCGISRVHPWLTQPGRLRHSATRCPSPALKAIRESHLPDDGRRTNPGTAPDTLKAYAVIPHGTESAPNKVCPKEWDRAPCPKGRGMVRAARPRGGTRRSTAGLAGDRDRYEARSAREYDPRGAAQDNGWPGHRQGGLVRQVDAPAAQ